MIALSMMSYRLHSRVTHLARVGAVGTTPYDQYRLELIESRFICYIGVAYHLPGSFMGERALLLTSHLKVMGLLDSARIL